MHLYLHYDICIYTHVSISKILYILCFHISTHPHTFLCIGIWFKTLSSSNRFGKALGKKLSWMFNPRLEGFRLGLVWTWQTGSKQNPLDSSDKSASLNSLLGSCPGILGHELQCRDVPRKHSPNAAWDRVESRHGPKARQSPKTIQLSTANRGCR